MSNPPATWRFVTAAILDFLTIFFVGGYVIGRLTGNIGESGFALSGWPAWALIALIGLYFVAGRLWGLRLWQRLLRAR
ncbi:MAG: hypothetical protein H6899_13775 [Rhodobacter sp.]|nr:hypothetical protein [Paracoccaceae bacterium]MCC0080985.1 hypothetical protein [Rhodobacter sp.]